MTKGRKQSTASTLAWFALLFAATTPVPFTAVASAAVPTSLEAVPARALVPFEMVDRAVYVQGTIGNSRPLWVLVSSGSAGSAIDAALAKELGLGQGAVFTIGGAEVAIEKLGRADLASSEDIGGHRVDAVIGYDLFRRYVVEIDYYGQLMRLHDPASYRADPRAASLPMRVDKGKAYLAAKVNFTGLKPVSREYRLDTGLGGALVDEAVLAAKTPKLDIVGDGFSLTLARAKTVGIGPFTFAGANAFNGEPAIGGELLRRFTTVFDYGRGRLILLPNRHYGDVFCFEMLGVELSNARAANGMRIDAIYKGSTAEKAGLKIGDILTAIDGRPTSQLPLGQVRMMFGQQNAYVLTVRRGDASRVVPVRLSPSL
jgi:hypothetical protein